MKKELIHTKKEIEEYENRLNSLNDKNYVAAKLKIRNLALYFKVNIIEADDKETAESLMIQLEEKDEELAEEVFSMLVDNMRQERDRILKGTDWLLVSDVKVEKKHRTIYLEYRQYLRDMPERARVKSDLQIESFDNYLRRNNPEEFLDGGKGKQIVKKFNYYL
jgi:hypothetical protein